MAPLRVAGLIEFHAVETESPKLRTYCMAVEQAAPSPYNGLMQEDRDFSELWLFLRYLLEDGKAAGGCERGDVEKRPNKRTLTPRGRVGSLRGWQGHTTWDVASAVARNAMLDSTRVVKP